MAEPVIMQRPGEPPPALLRALQRLLKPLVRVLIAHGITFPVLTRLLKEVYVDVAERDFPVPGKPQTDSRINLLTGIHRKDVKTLRNRERAAEAPPAVVSRNARMIAIWTGAPDYLDERGRPRPLPRNRPGDGGPSFEALVAAVSKDIRSRAVLDEWQRQKLVRIDDDGLVHLNTEAFVPREDFDDLAYYFGRNLRDHIAASGHNLLGQAPPMLERAVYYDKLRPQSVRQLAEEARALGGKALVELNRRAFELAERDEGAEDATERMTFGVYFYATSRDAGPNEDKPDE